MMMIRRAALITRNSRRLFTTTRVYLNENTAEGQSTEQPAVEQTQAEKELLKKLEECEKKRDEFKVSWVGNNE